uniref:Uncharacterized protein n=1 Tax=Solanum tuberosum TaxID=4113 RepID=M1DCS5_SOLTU
MVGNDKSLALKGGSIADTDEQLLLLVARLVLRLSMKRFWHHVLEIHVAMSSEQNEQSGDESSEDLT